MQRMDIARLREIDVTCKGVAGAKQNWKNGDKYDYLSRPRADSGFLLLFGKRAVYTFADGRSLTAEKNSLVYMPQGCRYLVRFEQDEPPVFPTSVMLQFTLLDADGEALVFSDEPEVWAREQNGEYEKLFLQVVEDYLRNDRLLLTRDFLTLLHELAQGAARNPMQAVIDYLARDLKALPTVKKLAQKFAMSESTLRRGFAKSLGCSPVQYIHRMKIEKAKRMLALPESNVEEIGAELGFFDGAHFHKVFRRYAGCSPKRYRENFLRK